MKHIEKECEDKCPNCDSENINWYDSELCDEVVVYSANCKDCNILS